MARLRNPVPTYRKHSRSGKAIVVLTDPSGRRKTVYLGAFGTAASKREYARVLAEWQAGGKTLSAEQVGEDLSINELVQRFKIHAEQHYRHADGTPTAEQENYRLSLLPLRELYGHTLARNFGPLALKAVRNKMIETKIPGKRNKTGEAKLSRKLINQRIGRIKRLFKWATSDELIPSSVFVSLRTVDGLQRGRSAAKDRPRVLPVSDADIQATIPHINRHVAGMIKMQRLTGMRPGEVASLTRSEIDMSGEIWVYKPANHKTAYRGKERLIAIGPQGQALLKEFFTPAIDDYLFSPARAREERYAILRANRKTKVQPSQANRRKRNPKKKPRERYGASLYAAAIRRGCTKAGVTAWHPNRLRHTWATEIRRRYGLEGAQVGLGHSSANVTQIYAETHSALAAKIAAEVG